MAQIEDYLDEIEELLESGRGSAFSGKTSVDADAIKTVIEDMRLDIPEEIKQAKFLRPSVVRSSTAPIRKRTASWRTPSPEAAST